MNLGQRFSLLVKGHLNGLFDALEDPEKSLYQLILDMEEQLEAAKQATSQAMANEDRLRQQIEWQRREIESWEEAANGALERGKEAEARLFLKRAEHAERRIGRLQDRLEAQEEDTAQMRDTVWRWHEQVEEARARLDLLQARMRQREVRRHMGDLTRGVVAQDLRGEFERLGDKVDRQCAVDRAYFRLDAEMRGEDVRERVQATAVDLAVEARLDRLRRERSTNSERTG